VGELNMKTKDSWEALPAAVYRMYVSVDAESARLRGAHLNTVVRLMPPTMAANLGSALLIVWTFGPAVPQGLWLWLAFLGLYAGKALITWRKFVRVPMETASPRVVRRTTAHALLLAGTWCVMALLWFPGASAGQQMTVATLVTGMIGAGSFVLSPLPLASLAYVAVFSVGALVALWRTGDPGMLGVALLVGLYSPMVAIGSLAAWRKATALIRAQARSARQEQLLAMLLQDFEQQAGDALWEVSLDGKLKHPSPRLCELLALEPHAGADPSFAALARLNAPEDAAALLEALDSGRPFRSLQLAWHCASQTRHLSFSGKRLLDDEGRSLGWRGVVADVSERVHSEVMLRELAHTDSLTGLANRFVLREALAKGLQQQQHLALLSVDLDHFKGVNDNHGHSAGDELLRAVAMRLRTCVRPADLVARLGGDEFAILVLESTAAAEPARLAQRVIDTLNEPIEIGDRRVRVGASVGVALNDGSPIGVDDMLVRSDMALYAAKDGGRGRHVVYSPALGELSHRRLAIENGLRQALRHGGLTLHWQAKVDIASWQVTGAEALARWEHPQLGRVNPAEFIAVAEDCGLIEELGRWALKQACHAAMSALRGLVISVNVSPVQLRDEGFVSYVRQLLRESGLPPAQLELEITESVFIADADDALAKLHALRSLGIRVALDDFGTGYSSLSYLRRFPFDTLKIDRSFVGEVLLRQDSRAIVEMVAHLATTLGVSTVCEGVETADQLRVVSQAGCDQVQGYLISRPCPIDELVQLQRHWRRGSQPALQIQ
jgi:diguanylate cyclase (GGDEF)-like protein